MRSDDNVPALGVPGFTLSDLRRPERLRDLFDAWERGLASSDPPLHARYNAWRQSPGPLPPVELSNLLTAVAPHVSEFVARLFNLSAERDAERERTRTDLLIFRFKDEFVKRRALKRALATDSVDAALQRGSSLLTRLGVAASQQSDERRVAEAVCGLLDREVALKGRPVPDNGDPELIALREDLDAAADWVVAKKGELKGSWLSYRFAHGLDFDQLVELERPDPNLPELCVGPEHHRRSRDGFKLTDRRMHRLEVLDQVDYCIYCHDRDKDSCSKGLREATKSNDKATKAVTLKKNPLGITLEGCPLDEKISEMHTLKRQGDPIGALALVTLDNPMCAGTGHRICNDCMKGCIYQKQQPVNIPQIETGVLTDVLALPYGFEIYDLLTRWNPLDARRPYALPYNGKNVLVVGMGPAGYTLTHHLLNEGFGVVGIDGLKLEPPPARWVGDPDQGVLPEPIADYQQAIAGELDARVLSGFGGVSEYGITVRWDKNFLDVVRILLARRERLRLFGGVRFGGTLELEDAWRFGFHHVAVAVGAGKPTLIDLENNLIRGIRKASDFLMALQLTGAYKRDSLANLQVRLPAVVIGGGLTAIDTATELRAYYVVQVEKELARYESLAAAGPESDLLGPRSTLDAEERGILAEQIAHGRAVRAERAAAAAEGREPSFNALLDSWGGVTLVYRKSLADAPAYRLNHEEVEKGFEEGIRIVEKMAPKSAIPDEYGAIKAITFERQSDEGGKWRATGEIIELPARTLCVAAGTSPNTIYEKERPGTFALDKRGYFAPHKAVRDASGNLSLVPDPSGFFTSYNHEGRLVSYYGDNHPKYAGSVVRAMASGKHGYRAVAELLLDEPGAGQAQAQATNADAATLDSSWRKLAAEMSDALSATVHEVIRLTPTIVEVVVHAPLAARKFQPGQFYRLQNFETISAVADGTRMTMEGLALTGAWTDPERGLLSMIILEMGGSSNLCAKLRPGERVVVMGPTGAPTHIPSGETVLLAGGGLGNAVLFSIGRAMREAGNRVLYFAGYRNSIDVYHRDDIERGADQVIWAVDRGGGEPIVPRRAEDCSFVGNIVEAMIAYDKGELGERRMPLSTVDRIIAIGSDRMMNAVAKARHGVLEPHLKKEHIGLGSINSPMQCMMKEVCAQCLQKWKDPVTGKETVVFTCFNQDQPLDQVDFGNLAARLRLNSVQEKLTSAWIRKLMTP